MNGCGARMSCDCRRGSAWRRDRGDRAARFVERGEVSPFEQQACQRVGGERRGPPQGPGAVPVAGRVVGSDSERASVPWKPDEICFRPVQHVLFFRGEWLRSTSQDPGERVPRGAERAVAREHRKGTPSLFPRKPEDRRIFRKSEKRPRFGIAL